MSLPAKKNITKKFKKSVSCVIVIVLLSNVTAASRLLVKINYFAAGTMAIVPRDHFRPMTIDFTAGRPRFRECPKSAVAIGSSASSSIFPFCRTAIRLRPGNGGNVCGKNKL